MAKVVPSQLHHPVPLLGSTGEWLEKPIHQTRRVLSGSHPLGLALPSSPSSALTFHLLSTITPSPPLIPSASAKVKPSSLDWTFTSFLPPAIQVELSKKAGAHTPTPDLLNQNLHF